MLGKVPAFLPLLDHCSQARSRGLRSFLWNRNDPDSFAGLWVQAINGMNLVRFGFAIHSPEPGIRKLKELIPIGWAPILLRRPFRKLRHDFLVSQLQPILERWQRNSQFFGHAGLSEAMPRFKFDPANRLFLRLGQGLPNPIKATHP